MRALEFQELCKKEGIKRFTINGKEFEWLDVWYGFIKNPNDNKTFITLDQVRNIGDDNLNFQSLTNSSKKGCGKDICGVHTYSEEFGEDLDIQTCGEYCPYHKEIHYCDDCKKLKAVKDES